jgi:nitroreductase
MTGFIANKVHKVLQLPENEKPVAFLAIGELSPNSLESSPFPKQRLPLSETVKYD